MNYRIALPAVLLLALAACDSGRAGSERTEAGGSGDSGVELKEETLEAAASSETALEQAGEAIERDSKPQDRK